MRVTTILGSPRKRGNTAAVLSAFEGLIAPTHEVERIDIVDYRVNGCLGCDACFKALDEPGCVQKDDGMPLLRRLLAADVVIYAAPVYSWGFPAQIKALVDRHYCLVKWREGQVARAFMEGKPMALLVTCGGGVENNADLIREAFDRQADYLGAKVVGHYALGDCTTPAELGERARQMAEQMAREIGSL